MDDNNVVRQWQEFQLTAFPELQRYFKMELDIQNRLDQAADDIQEQDKIDNTNLDQLQWQQAAGMRPVEEHCSSIRTSSNGNVPNWSSFPLVFQTSASLRCRWARYAADEQMIIRF